MTDHYDNVKGVDWREVFPWTTLTRAFSVAVSIPVLLLASLGVGITISGWQFADYLLVSDAPAVELVGATSEDGSTGAQSDLGGEAFTEATELESAEDDPEETKGQMPPTEYREGQKMLGNSDYRALPLTVNSTDQDQSIFEQLLNGNVLGVIRNTYDSVFGGARELDAKTGSALCIVQVAWLLTVWSFFGATITRIAVIRIGRGEKISLKEAMADVRRKYISYLMSPLFVLVSCFVLSLPMVLISLLLNFDVGVVLASVLWIIVIIAGIGVTVLLTGFFFGWPLMWPTISAEEAGDVYEATSRTFAYTFQAPLQYLFYVLVSIAIWIPSVMLVQNFIAVAEQVVFSATSVAADESSLIQQFIAGETTLESQSGTFQVGANIIYGLHWFAHLMADSFCAGFFFASFSGVYLLLRRYVDHTALDEVFVIDDKTKYGLEDLIQQSTEEAAAQVAD